MARVSFGAFDDFEKNAWHESLGVWFRGYALLVFSEYEMVCTFQQLLLGFW